MKDSNGAKVPVPTLLQQHNVHTTSSHDVEKCANKSVPAVMSVEQHQKCALHQFVSALNETELEELDRELVRRPAGREVIHGCT